MPPLKMISHNHLLSEADGGETAFARAAEMGISYVRYDFRWHQLTAGDGWQWEAGGPDRWNDLLDPALRWTKDHGMRTLVNLLAFKAPQSSMPAMNARWVERTGGRPLDKRDCSLWAAWAAGNGVDLGVPTPRDYAEALVGRLAEGQRQGDYDIAGFCILNEPNTRWPAEDNWRSISVDGGTYDTADHVTDLLGWVKGGLGDDLDHTVNVVNLYPFLGHWRRARWDRVARNDDLDVLGIDVYWDQWLGLMAWGVPGAMGRISREVGKPWWLVETAGSHGPGRWWRRPSCRRIERHSERCRANGAEVLGYYRLWGDYTGRFNFGAAYNVFTDPGPAPTARTDGRGRAYWECIRDL